MGNLASAEAAPQAELPAVEDAAAPDAAAAADTQEQPRKGADESDAKEAQDGEDLVQVQEDEAMQESAATEQEAAAGNDEGGETQDEAAQEEEEQPKFQYKIEDVKTAPFDPRFPTTNQTKHCYTRYNEFHKCEKERGEGSSECQKYKRWYLSLCPMDWIERWDEQREAGVFPGPY